MWLVPRVHDRSLQRRLQPDLGLHEVGALAELELDAVDPRLLAADLARAAEHWSRVTKNGMSDAASRANGTARSRR